MTTDRSAIVTPNTSTDNARNRPARLPRRQRIVSALASAVVAGVMLGGVVFGMVQANDAPVVAAGPASVSASAA
ncbi:MAG: hypothetical protein ACJ8GJ_11540 [Vitreoscilla sp.]